MTHGAITASMKTDRWATAFELLSRRDELLLAGWGGRIPTNSPALYAISLAPAAGRAFVFPSEADRLRQVLRALDDGQVLPPHQCMLLDSPDAWPAICGAVLGRLNIADAPQTAPHAPPHSALYAVSGSFAVRQVPGRTRCDLPLRPNVQRVRGHRVRCRRPRAIAGHVGEHGICVDDDDVALRLDACLRRAGLPTAGASGWSRAHPVLQVLPLTLALLEARRSASPPRFPHTSHRSTPPESHVTSRQCPCRGTRIGEQQVGRGHARTLLPCQ